MTTPRITIRGGILSAHFSHDSALETCLDYRCRLGLEPGLVAAPDPLLDLLSRAGVQHEAATLDRLEAEGRQLTRIGRQEGDADKSRQTALTLAAMCRGDPLISGGFLQAGDRMRTLAGAAAVEWRLPVVPTVWGEPDLLQRVDDPEADSAFGPWYYQPADIKSSRQARLPGRLQVAFYGLLLADVQAVRPERGAILPKPLERVGAVPWEFFDLDPFYDQLHRFLWDDYWRIVTSDPRELARDDALASPLAKAWARREGLIVDDPAACDLACLPGLHREARRHLRRLGLQRIQDLATATPELLERAVGPGLRATGVRTLQLQAQSCAQGRPRWRRRASGRAGGSELALLREPVGATVILDLENDPLTDRDYLYGLAIHRAGDPPDALDYRHIWATSDDEAGTLQAACDLLATLEGLIAGCGSVLVVHYGHVERSRLRRLAERHPDILAPARVEAVLARFLDLHRLLTTQLFLPVTSYSLKTVAPVLERLPEPGGPGRGHRWLALPSLEALAEDLRSAGWSSAAIAVATDELRLAATEGDWAEPAALLAPSAGMSVLWSERLHRTGHAVWLHLLTAYNADDLRATGAVLRYLRALLELPRAAEDVP